MDHEKIGEDINNFNWYTITTQTARFELLTSDRPVVMSPLGKKDAFLVLPVGPRRLFLATRNSAVGDRIRRKRADELVIAVNTTVVEAAVKFVYGSNDSQPRFVQNRMGLGQNARWLERLSQLAAA